MTKRAWVFPGQGSQKVGMGQALDAAFADAHAVFQEVDDALGQHLTRLMFEGPEDDLRLTINAQPALMAVSLAVVRVLDRQGGFRLPEAGAYVAGHSLGEYAALAAAGSLTLADTARLLRVRGQAMQEAVPVGVGGMAAILGADWDAAEAMAAAASAPGELCCAANDNAPGQVVISGHLPALERALALAAERGFSRSVRLPVSAPFHSPLMEPATVIMRTALANVALQKPCVPVVANVTAESASDPTLIRDLLVRQVTSPVRWRESVLALKAQGVEQMVEIGAGTVLAGLTRRIDRALATASLHTPEDIEAFLKTV